MKKLIALLISVILVIIILIVGIMMMINKNIKDEAAIEQLLYQNSIDNPGYIIKDQKPEKVKLENLYFSIDSCVQKMLSYVKEDNRTGVYNLLKEDYIKSQNITEDNVFEAIHLQNIKYLKLKEAYVITGLNYSSYYLKTLINGGNNIYFNVNWDTENEAFDLKLITKEEYEKAINETITDVKSEEETIEKNNYNGIPYKYLGEDDLVEKYFLDYIENAVEFPEEAYNNLDEEYRNKKFGSLENFRQYVKNNPDIEDIYKTYNTNMEDYSNYMEYLTSNKNIKIEKYSKQNQDGYTKYICQDTYNNYYIFKVTGIMQYSIILDTYTIPIPEFTKKYETSNAEEKVILNINKFMQSLNDKDYKYAYSLLADSFKEANFKTQKDFENYIKTNFFEKNEFKYEKFGDEANTYYTYQIKVTDRNKKKDEELTKTFIILLEDRFRF